MSPNTTSRKSPAGFLKAVGVALASVFVLIALAGFLEGPSRSAYAATVSSTPGTDIVYGKVLNSSGKGQPGARVVLYKYTPNQVLVSISYTNKNGVYRIAPRLATGNYYIQFNNPANTVRGHTKFHVVNGRNYRVSAKLTVNNGVFFYLPIFSY